MLDERKFEVWTRPRFDADLQYPIVSTSVWWQVFQVVRFENDLPITTFTKNQILDFLEKETQGENK